MAVAVYGTMAAAAKKIGIISRWTINRLFEEFGWKRGEMS
jgi:hypothetical protein